MRTLATTTWIVLGGLLGMWALAGDSVASGSDESEEVSRSDEVFAQAPSRVLNTHTEFYVPEPDDAAVAQVRALTRARDRADARKLTDLIETLHAVWFTSGTPSDVKSAVRKTVAEAACGHKVPVLVAYNVPFRDCAQYSSGGATDTTAYKAWIDGFAQGIGKGKAVVILEPDSLGIIPYNTTINGSQDWCKPTVTDSSGTPLPAPGASPEERYAQLNYAVDSIESHAPQASVYLDSGHSAWLGVGEAAYRLTKAGVARAQGFFLNVSNYQLTSDSIQFGTWVSDAIAAPSGAPTWAFDASGNFHFDWLPSQYDPATNYTQINYSPDYAATVTAGIQSFMGSAVATTHFIIDTSRNGQGPLNTAAYALAPYDQSAAVLSGLHSGNWCNPFGAGAGLPPSANTGVALLDAYLWVKVPGESDGSCDIAGGARAWDYTAYNPWGLTGDAQNHFDPLWGMVDPAAGAWFAAQALQLAQNANPSLH
jgi:endoglucanase